MLSAVYIISSLPALSFGEKPPISMDEFIHDISSQLSKKNFSKVAHIDIRDINKTSAGSKLNSVAALQNSIQDDLGLIRKTKRDNNLPKLNILSKVLIESKPLERERLLMKLYWDELSSIEFGESFTLAEVMIYKLKLQILERLNSFNTEKGRTIFESLVNTQSIQLD